MKYRFYTPKELDRLPAPRWLVKGAIPSGGFTVIYGPSNIGKSFVALDLAFSVALGNSWFGRDTRQGDVIYVSAGEGKSSMKFRKHAWERYNDTEVEHFAWTFEPVYLNQPQSVRNFLDQIPSSPRLVVLDTLARCSVGINENSVDGMGLAIQGVDTIRSETRAAVIVIHHTTKPDEDGNVTYRGSTALEAAADTMIEVAGDNNVLAVRCRKQRDAKKFYDLRFRLREVRFDKDNDSAVVVPRS